MPALTYKKILEEIKAAGYDVQLTSKGHYYVVDASGNKIVNFAVGHGKNKGMVNAAYVVRVRKALAIKEGESS